MTQQVFNHFAFATSISLERLAERVAAAFAEHAAESTGPRHVCISTREIVSRGLCAVERHADGGAPRQWGYARHLLRFQPMIETVSLQDALP